MMWSRSRARHVSYSVAEVGTGGATAAADDDEAVPRTRALCGRICGGGQGFSPGNLGLVPMDTRGDSARVASAASATLYRASVLPSRGLLTETPITEESRRQPFSQWGVDEEYRTVALLGRVNVLRNDSSRSSSVAGTGAVGCFLGAA